MTKLLKEKPTTDSLKNTKYLVDKNMPKFENVIAIDIFVYVQGFSKPLIKQEDHLTPSIQLEHNS